MQQMNAGKTSVQGQITPKRKAMPKRRMQPGVRRATQGYAQDSGYFVFTASPENDKGMEFSSFCGMILMQGSPVWVCANAGCCTPITTDATHWQFDGTTWLGFCEPHKDAIPMFKYYTFTASELREKAKARNLHLLAKKRDKVSLVSGLKEYDQMQNPILKQLIVRAEPPSVQAPPPPRRAKPPPPSVLAPMRMKAPRSRGVRQRRVVSGRQSLRSSWRRSRAPLTAGR